MIQKHCNTSSQQLLTQRLKFVSPEQISYQMTKYYEAMTNISASDCLLSKNVALWAKTAQAYWYEKCGEEFEDAKNVLGAMPRQVRKKAVKPRTGGIRELIRRGGGDLSTRIWASRRVKVLLFRKRRAKGATSTPAFKDVLQSSETFGYTEGQHNERKWKIAEEKRSFKTC